MADELSAPLHLRRRQSAKLRTSKATTRSSVLVFLNQASQYWDRLIEIKQSAQVIEGFATTVESIADCIPYHLNLHRGQQSLVRIRRRLNIGASLPMTEMQSSVPDIQKVTFELQQDMPGSLSKHGARHDNDHQNIADIGILPTAQEISSHRPEYLPLLDTRSHHLTGLAGLLDRQFRLLHEDTVGQLRDAVRRAVTSLQQTNRTVPEKHQRNQGVRNIV